MNNTDKLVGNVAAQLIAERADLPRTVRPLMRHDGIRAGSVWTFDDTLKAYVCDEYPDKCASVNYVRGQLWLGQMEAVVVPVQSGAASRVLASIAVSVLMVLSIAAHAQQGGKCGVCSGYKVVKCQTCLGAKIGTDATVTNDCEKCDDGSIVVPRMRKVDGRAGKRASYVKIGEEKVQCKACRGAGFTTTRERTYCTTCNGRGYVKCQACGGAGVTNAPADRPRSGTVGPVVQQEVTP